VSSGLDTWIATDSAIVRAHQELRARHGQSARALWYRSAAAQRAFHDHLLAGARLRPSLSVLDIGCGHGHLLDALRRLDVNVHRYVGLDLVEEFVQEARTRWPDQAFEFRQENFLRAELAAGERFDLVSSLGVLMQAQPDQESFVEHTVQRMLACSQGLVLFNVITAAPHDTEEYAARPHLGHPAVLSREDLSEILARSVGGFGDVVIVERSVYPGVTDAFVRIERTSRPPDHTTG
jgi:2-polyprenyl-3-methyl-5-hydroxy-6-metoxy-1,4-benzoquinol methylase